MVVVYQHELKIIPTHNTLLKLYASGPVQTPLFQTKTCSWSRKNRTYKRYQCKQVLKNLKDAAYNIEIMEKREEKKQNNRKEDEKRPRDLKDTSTPSAKEWDPNQDAKENELSAKEKLERSKDIRKPNDSDQA